MFRAASLAWSISAARVTFSPSARTIPRSTNPAGPVYKLLGGPVAEKEDAAKSASPVTHVTADDPPFLIMHGTDDRTVAIRQAEILHEAQKKAGVKTLFVKINGGGHGIGGPKVEGACKRFSRSNYWAKISKYRPMRLKPRRCPQRRRREQRRRRRSSCPTDSHGIMPDARGFLWQTFEWM